MSCRRAPRPSSTRRASALYEELLAERLVSSEFAGGTVGNTLHNYSLLADDASILLGVMSDPIRVGTSGYRYLSNTSSRVNLDHLQPVDGPIGRCFALVTPDGERTFAISAGKMNDLRPDSVRNGVFDRAACLVISAYLMRVREGEPMPAATLRAISLAKERGVPVVLTVGTRFLIAERPEVWRGFIAEHVDVVAMNEEEGEALTGAADPLLACDRVLDWADLVLCTAGPAGLYLAAYTDDEVKRQTRYPLLPGAIPEFNRYEFSRPIARRRCANPVKAFAYWASTTGGPADHEHQRRRRRRAGRAAPRHVGERVPPRPRASVGQARARLPDVLVDEPGLPLRQPRGLRGARARVAAAHAGAPRARGRPERRGLLGDVGIPLLRGAVPPQTLGFPPPPQVIGGVQVPHCSSLPQPSPAGPQLGSPAPCTSREALGPAFAAAAPAAYLARGAVAALQLLAAAVAGGAAVQALVRAVQGLARRPSVDRAALAVDPAAATEPGASNRRDRGCCRSRHRRDRTRCAARRTSPACTRFRRRRRAFRLHRRSAEECSRRTGSRCRSRRPPGRS